MFCLYSLPATHILPDKHHAAQKGRKAVIVNAKKASAAPKGASKGTPKVDYGKDWYAATREAAKPKRTVREEIEFRRAANAAANNGRERKDLYTDNWDGSEYKGSRWNILTVIALVSILTPLLGLVFAFNTYGILWG